MDPDTSIGGAQDRFPETSRSAVFALRSEDEATRTRAWDTLAVAYWKPLYKYTRFKWNLSNEDAKDLVQGFFRHVVEKNILGVYDERQAAFRTFLRTCFDRYATNEWQAAQRLKRGGAVAWAPLSDKLVTEGAVDKLFHDEWVRNIFTLSISDLELESKDSGRQTQFEVFSRYDLADPDRRPNYAAIAANLNITTATVTNYLAAMRRRLRLIVLNRLRDITANDREYRSEARAVLGIEVE